MSGDRGKPRSTLVWGTANPEGLKDSYRGVYLNVDDISSMVEQVGEANWSILVFLWERLCLLGKTREL